MLSSYKFERPAQIVLRSSQAQYRTNFVLKNLAYLICVGLASKVCAFNSCGDASNTATTTFGIHSEAVPYFTLPVHHHKNTIPSPEKDVSVTPQLHVEAVNILKKGLDLVKSYNENINPNDGEDIDRQHLNDDEVMNPEDDKNTVTDHVNKKHLQRIDKENHYYHGKHFTRARHNYDQYIDHNHLYNLNNRNSEIMKTTSDRLNYPYQIPYQFKTIQLPYEESNSVYNNILVEPAMRKHYNTLIDDVNAPIYDKRVHFEEIPLVQEESSAAEKMLLLDKYTLKRKITHFMMPVYVNELTSRLDDIPKLKRSVHFHSDGEVKSDTNDDNKSDIDNKVVTTKSKYFRDVIEPVLMKDLDKTILAKNPKMLDILKNQTERMNELIYMIQDGSLRRSAYAEFEDIWKRVNERQVKSRADRLKEATNEKQLTTKLLPTQEMVIDAAMVREALVHDPYVQRILKLSNKNREGYWKNMKKS